MSWSRLIAHLSLAGVASEINGVVVGVDPGNCAAKVRAPFEGGVIDTRGYSDRNHQADCGELRFLHALMVGVAERLFGKMGPVPLFWSGNLDGVAEKNYEMMEPYRARVRFW